MEAVSLPAERLELLLGAFQTGGKRKTEIQAEHFHEAFGIHAVIAVADTHIEGTGGGQIHKIMDILDGTQPYCEFFHTKNSSLYKDTFIVYNWGERFGPRLPESRETGMVLIIRVFSKNATVGSDDFNK